ncbi:polyphosphate kinase 1 [Taibaiella helva]|uniref:polyphosphate kinase 1 n=1 Tax=Taibaiella helva TaxID=2301235 RepID=UPI000E575199|nr:polyphosphate kinase 1 [Taibaiella helva]
MKKKKDAPIIRDLSWLAFNDRVMQEAKDPSVHIYDRLRFLGIFSNNQDEFFRVRVAALSRMVRMGKSAKMHLEQNPDKILQAIQEKVLLQSADFDRTYAGIIRELAKSNIFIKNEKQLSSKQEHYIKSYFDEKIRTQIVPLMIESMPQAPFLQDNAIYLACVLGSNENPMMQRYALIEIPLSNLPRFVLLPSEKDTKDIILLEDIIRWNLPNLFAAFGFNRFLSYIIKVTRDAEFELDYDVNKNLIQELEKGIKDRKKGRATRFVYDRNIDPGLLAYLTKRLNLAKKDNLIPGGRIHNFKDFMNFPASVFRDFDPRQKPFVHPLLIQPCRIMDVLNHKDVMLNFPYHSFDSIIDLLREAAIDPFVQSIKITCYRLAKDSKIVNALVNAVRNGKDVTAVVELRARFDEEANLKWKARLEDEGVKVILGLPDQKVHAKLCVIKKREFEHTKEYGFISTGNFNEGSAQYYGDHCLLTADRKIMLDINRIFNYLEDPLHKIAQLKAIKTLAVAPVNMRTFWFPLIDKEIKAAKAGKEASMIIKLNSLVDAQLIGKLYEAATAGVKVNLIVRGICCVLTKQKAFARPIFAISIIDEYLEHARVFVFHNEGKPKVFISSADWMVRNLDHRVEAACPIFDKEISQELIDILNIQLAENVKGRILDNQQRNEYVEPAEGDADVRSQIEIYDYLFKKTIAI